MDDQRRFIVILPDGRGDVIDAGSPPQVLRIIRRMLGTPTRDGNVPRRTQVWEIKARRAVESQ